MVLNKFKIISLVLLFIGLIILTFFIISNIWQVITFKMKNSEDKMPCLYKTPERRILEKPNIKFNNVQNIEAHGVKLKMPWNKIVKRKEKKSSLFYEFNNIALVLHDKVLKKTIKETDPKAVSFWGKETLESKYNFFSYILETTPKQLSIFSLPKKRKQISQATTLKSILIPTNQDCDMYNFMGEEIKGFEYVFRKNSYLVYQFSCFNNNDSEFIFSIISKSDEKISQQKIDYVLSSLEF